MESVIMSPESAAQLRAPFSANAIGKLPKPYRKDSERGNCTVCGGYHGLPAVHLDYVGHAAATDRLLQVDPCWTWEPFALTADGLPALDRDGNLWIRLTVCGVTRPGVGDGQSMKERIGDAIRNAAMRFGVALDLWAKEDLHDEQDAPVRQASPDEQEAQELFDRLRGASKAAQDFVKEFAAPTGRKLTVNELVDAAWRQSVSDALDTALAVSVDLGDALADTVEANKP